MIVLMILKVALATVVFVNSDSLVTSVKAEFNRTFVDHLDKFHQIETSVRNQKNPICELLKNRLTPVSFTYVGTKLSVQKNDVLPYSNLALCPYVKKHYRAIFLPCLTLTTNLNPVNKM